MQNTSTEIAQLASLSAFGALSEETIRFLISNGEIIRLPSDTNLFQYGDPADEFYIILSGSIQFLQSQSGKAALVREYLAGDQIGVSAMITLNPRQGDGIAASDCKVLKVSTSVFNQLYNRNHQDFAILLMNMFRDMARGLKKEREEH